MLLYPDNPPPNASPSARAGEGACAPPFSNRAHAILFAFILLAVAIAPQILQAVAPPDPAQVYRNVPLTYGNYYTIGKTFSESESLDVLILGASDGWTAIDPSVIASELGKALGRPARVMNFGTNWAGEDRMAQLLADMDQRLKAKLVIGLENNTFQYAPHALSKYWWRGQIPVAPLGPVTAAQFHMMRVLGAPRQIWNTLTQSAGHTLTEQSEKASRKLVDTKGFHSAERGWLSHANKSESDRRVMPSRIPATPLLPPDALFFKGKEDDRFKFRPKAYTPLQSYFYRQVFAAVQAQGGLYATVSLPTHFKDTLLDRVEIRELADGRPRDWPVIGISMKELFSPLSFDELKSYYANESHLNPTGAKAFTLAVMPAIRILYEQALKR